MTDPPSSSPIKYHDFDFSFDLGIFSLGEIVKHDSSFAQTVQISWVSVTTTGHFIFFTFQLIELQNCLLN